MNGWVCRAPNWCGMARRYFRDARWVTSTLRIPMRLLSVLRWKHFAPTCRITTTRLSTGWYSQSAKSIHNLPPIKTVGRARSNLMVGPLEQTLDHRHQASYHRSSHHTGDHVSQERQQDTGNARN